MNKKFLLWTIAILAVLVMITFLPIFKVCSEFSYLAGDVGSKLGGGCVRINFWQSIASTFPPNPAIPPIVDSSEEFSGWKTFTSTTYGISISYPQDFTTSDGVDDFVHNRPGEIPLLNSEYFVGAQGSFGIQLQDYAVSQSLIDSWGAEVGRNFETLVNGEPAWVVENCAANGCSVSVMFLRGEKTILAHFFEDFMDISKPLLINASAEKILSTLKF